MSDGYAWTEAQRLSRDSYLCLYHYSKADAIEIANVSHSFCHGMRKETEKEGRLT